MLSMMASGIGMAGGMMPGMGRMMSGGPVMALGWLWMILVPLVIVLLVVLLVRGASRT